MSNAPFASKGRRLRPLRFESLEPRHLLNAGPLIISEFMALNQTGWKDDFNEYSDWIEIHNPTAEAVTLDGWYLTDKAGTPTMWRFPDPTGSPDLVLQPGGYLLIAASERDRAVLGSRLHTNFKLSGGGEYLGLIQPDGVTVSYAYAPEFPSQLNDISYGVDPTTGELQYFTMPTPGWQNVTGALGVVAAPSFSVERGFYDDPIFVSLANDTAGSQIRYTVDGSKPTATTGIVYSGNPIYVGTTAVIRAAAFKVGYIASDVETHSYVFAADVPYQTRPANYPTTRAGIPIHYSLSPDIYNNAAYAGLMTDALTALPSISLVLPMADYFGPSGIYMNPLSEGDAWERATSAEWIFQDGTASFQIDAGLQIQGGASRSPSNTPKQSMGLRFGSEYGESKLDYPLFGDEGVSSFNSLQLRAVYNNSWVHWGSDQRNRGQLIQDQWMRDTMLAMGNEDAGLGYFVHVYINGLYWGVFNLHERPDATHYAGYNDADVDVVDAINGGTAVDGTIDSYNRMKAVVTTKDWENIQRVLDVDTFIDWTIANRFGGNKDLKNDGNWRAAGGGPNDLPWKYYSWDAEHVLYATDTNMPSPVADPSGLLSTLQTIPEFKMRFADRLHQHLFNGGALTPENTAARYAARAEELEVAIVAESARWGSYRRDVHSYSSGPYDLYQRDVQWVAQRDYLLNTYFPQRSTNILNRYRTDGWYPMLAAPVYNQHGGQVDVGHQVLMGATGPIYYTLDGSDPRLPGGAISPTARLYETASTNVTLVEAQSIWKYLDNGSNQGTAWYAPGFDDGAWAAGPAILGYGETSQATLIGYGPDEDNKYTTTYFRRSFDLADADLIQSLTLEIMRDDGAVVYLNGVEIVRSNMAATGTINYNTFASSVVSSTNERRFFSYTIDPSYLVEGVNVLAVEVHQVDLDSSDLSFDLKMTAVKGPKPAILSQSGPVRSRTFDGTTWSALNEAMFYVGDPAVAGKLAITEINYNPHLPTAAEQALGFLDGQQFEFIELRNVGDDIIDLTGVQFTNGVEFDFTNSAVVSLAPGEYVLVVSNVDAFAARYGSGLPVAGAYVGSLSNGGETLTLGDRLGGVIHDFAYDDEGNWATRPDGFGSSLEVIDLAGDYDSAANWRASTRYGGSPAAAGIGPIATIVINEVLTHTDLPEVDAIELMNLTGQPINVGGWFLSDSGSDLWQYQFPTDQSAWTTIAAGGYLVIEETAFLFRLSSLGEKVWLVSADATGKPLNFVDVVEFPAAANGESFGRWPNGTGILYPMLTTTLGGPNSGPRVGPVVISEIMYAPTAPTAAELALCPTMVAADFEFVEIYNPLNASVDLTEWRIRAGIDYDFVAGTTLAPRGTIVVLPFDPRASADMWAAFSTRYFGSVIAVPGNFFGAYTSNLNNGGEMVRLLRPDTPQIDDPTIIPRLLVDEVDYRPTSPWPTLPLDADGALVRLDPTLWGHDAASWTMAAPLPGATAYTPDAATVASRHIFYNDSAFDGNGTAVGTADYAAIATDKTALLPGELATLANYISYAKGINGIVIDVAGLWSTELQATGSAVTSSFEFRIGNDDSPDGWRSSFDTQNAVPLPEVFVHAGQGVDGADRVLLVWANGALPNHHWLQVRVVANSATGLEHDDVFYFGLAIGDTGADNAGTRVLVNVADAMGARKNPVALPNLASIDNLYDFDRDRDVDQNDQLIARNHPTVFSQGLALISPPALPQPPSPQPTAQQPTAPSLSPAAELDESPLWASPLVVEIEPDSLASSPESTRSAVETAAMAPSREVLHDAALGDAALGDDGSTLHEARWRAALQWAVEAQFGGRATRLQSLDMAFAESWTSDEGQPSPPLRPLARPTAVAAPAASEIFRVRGLRLPS